MPRPLEQTSVRPWRHIAVFTMICVVRLRRLPMPIRRISNLAHSHTTRGKLRCSTCDGTGTISLDVQFLPDVDVTCPDCHGTRYAQTADDIRLVCADSVARSLPELMLLSVDEMMPLLDFLRPVRSKLATLHELGLGYLTLGEPTPALSGGEAQPAEAGQRNGTRTVRFGIRVRRARRSGYTRWMCWYYYACSTRWWLLGRQL